MLWLLAGDSARAQTQSLFGSGGPRAQSRSSAGLSSSPQAGRSAATSMAGGGGLAAPGGGGLAAPGGRGAATAASGGGSFSGPQLSDVGSLSQMAVGNTGGFVGQSNTGTFVGNRMAGQQSLSAMQPSFTAPRGGGRNAFGGNVNPPQPQSAGETRTFRPQYRIGFDFTPRPAPEVAQRVEAQLSRLTSTTPALAGVQVAIDEAGVAEIRGQAPSEDARRLIENIVRLEPGVRSVTNLMEVAPASADGTR